MFNIFKRKTEEDKLNQAYKLLMQESYELSKINRTKSDQKMAEAQEILNRLDGLKDRKN